MPSLISHLSKNEQRDLFADMNYLNIGEIRAFCRAHSIPQTIWIETRNGERKRTKDTDRKSVVLDRVKRYLQSGHVGAATCFSADIVRLDGLPAKLTPRHRLYYGWYDKHSETMVGLLKRLTDGKFKNGAVARILAREFWTRGEAPTFKQYAAAWLEADAKGLWPHPEAAWLTDRARNQAGGDWKKKRQRKAAGVLKILGRIHTA